MKFSYTKIDTLPRLSWCAKVGRGSEAVEVLHGPWVETHENFFFEGAWDGEFEEGDFVSSEACFGSGAALANDKITFATPLHNVDKLYALNDAESISISNTLAFLLAQSGEELAPDYIFYNHDLDGICFGIHDYTKSIPLKSGKTVSLYIHRNIEIASDLKIIDTLKPQRQEPFKSYDEYISYLKTKTKALTQNIESPARKIRYTPLTTISTGYDSPAVSIIAQECGCTKSITVAEARRFKTDNNDSGKEIAEILKLDVIEKERDSYKNKVGLVEAEFCAVGGSGQEVVFAGFEDEMEGTYLFTGCSFGRMIHPESSKDSFNKLKVGDASGSSQAEFRLRVGYIYLPIGYLAFQQANSVLAISNAPEMKPYFIPGDYNKPIARKLIEDYGIPRDFFGTDKKAITVLYHQEGLKNKMKPESYADYESFYKSRLTPWMRIKVKTFDTLCHLKRLNKKFNYYFMRISNLVGLNIKLPEIISDKYKNPMGENVFMFHWGNSHIKTRYLCH